MTRDLIDLMHDDVAARERSAAGMEPSVAALAGVARQVRRRRAVRRTVQVGGVTVAAAVLGAASWFGWQGHEVPVPAHTPTPSPSVTPRASASPAPSPSTPVVLEQVAGLPPTQALPPGLLEATTPGWVLTIYRSEPVGGEPGTSAVVHTLVLVSPSGERYRVVDLPLDRAVSLLRWDVGSTTAVVTIEGVGDELTGHVPRAELDLVTGALTPTPVDLIEYGGGPFYHGLTADGAELWSTATSTDTATSDVFRRTDDGRLELAGGIGFQRPLLDPTRTRLAADIWTSDTTFAVIDVVGGQRTELDYGVPGKRCDVVSWLDADSLLTMCATSTVVDHHLDLDDVALYRLDIADGSPQVTLLRQLADDVPVPDAFSGAALPDGRAVLRMVGREDEECGGGAAVWDGTSLVPLHGGPGGGYVTVTAVGGIVYVESSPLCREADPAELTAYDLSAGTSRLVAPPPTATPDGPGWATGLRTWVVAADPTPAS